jgi:hypothetical protein
MKTLSSQVLKLFRGDFANERVPTGATLLLMTPFISSRSFCILLMLMAASVLVGCSNPDPLAVASGPLFALNASRRQPTPQELAAPPAVTDR